MTHPPQGWAQPAPDEPAASGRTPSRGMGIFAVVLAILAFLVDLAGAGWAGFQTVRSLMDSNPATQLDELKVASAGLAAVGAVLLLVGAVKHGKRKQSGWIVLAVGVVFSAACGGLLLINDAASAAPAGLIAAGLGLVAVILAARSRFWLTTKPAPQQAAYPAQAQYGGQYAQGQPYGQQYPQQPPQHGYPQGQQGYGQQPPQR